MLKNMVRTVTNAPILRDHRRVETALHQVHVKEPSERACLNYGVIASTG